MKFAAAGGLIIMACLSVGALAAPQNNSEDRRKIAQCIDTARMDEGFAGNCIGIVADACIKAVKVNDHAAAVAASKACAVRELAVWRSRLQEAVTVINKSSTPKMRSAVAASQQSFASSRDQLCPLLRKLDHPPGVSLGEDDYCRLQETARRSLILEWLASAVEEH
jgi:hypothetical protein